MLTEFVGRTLTSFTHLNLESWGTATAGQPTWMRADNAVNISADLGVGPVLQKMDGLVHLLMATPGPNEGAEVRSVI